jgi:sugar lactone lactonase YvrE
MPDSSYAAAISAAFFKPSKSNGIGYCGWLYCLVVLLGCNTENAQLLLVANTRSDNVVVIDGNTGEYVRDFIARGSGGLTAPDDLTFGPDGNLYISSGTDTTGQILCFDGKTGAFINIFAKDSNMMRPYGIAFGPDGNMYVASFRTDKILKFNGNTGDFINVVAGGNGTAEGLINGPNDLLFGADGKLYVTTQGSVADGTGGISFSFDSQVLRVDIASGAVEVFAKRPPPLPASSGYVSFLGMALGPDSLIYTTDFAGGIRGYHPVSKELKQAIVTGTLFGGSVATTIGNLTFCEGTLYAPVFNTEKNIPVRNGVIRCDIANGQCDLITKGDSHLFRPVGIAVAK